MVRVEDAGAAAAAEEELAGETAGGAASASSDVPGAAADDEAPAAAAPDVPKKSRFKELNRTGVWMWLVVAQHMLKTICDATWMFFAIDFLTESRDPMEWPSLTLSLDQGSDGWSAGEFVH